MARKLKSFVDAFLEYTDGRGSPRIYRKWTAIFTVASALERKTWITTTKGQLFPNQYVILVGPAGVGKSLCTRLAHDLLSGLRTPETPFFLAPTSVTKASLIDRLDEAERRIVRPAESPSVVQFNSLQIVANEFGVFLPAWEAEFMNTLTDLWDCGRYAESRRTGNTKLEIPNTQLNLFSATTPAQLINLLPEGAWEQGFMSRVLMVYSGETAFTDLFAELDSDGKLYDALEHDLRDVYKIYGQMSVDIETQEALNDWGRSGGPPIPDHPKLVTYRQRRIAHLLKLCMVSAASCDSERIVTLDNFAEALDWLIELEAHMPDVFKSLKLGGDARAIEECYHFIYQKFHKLGKKPVPEHLIIAFLQERVPAHNVDRILDVMQRGQLLEKQFAGGGQGYVPMAKGAD
jgi:hypothetical protein